MTTRFHTTGGALLGLLLIGSLFLPLSASGHAFPDHSDPRVGSEVKSSPAQVKIWFDGRIEPLFSTIQVVNQQGARVDDGQGGVDAADPTLLATVMPSLPPGLYTVIWDVVAVDGHRTEGKFHFTIRSGP